MNKNEADLLLEKLKTLRIVLDTIEYHINKGQFIKALQAMDRARPHAISVCKHPRANWSHEETLHKLELSLQQSAYEDSVPSLHYGASDPDFVHINGTFSLEKFSKRFFW